MKKGTSRFFIFFAISFFIACLIPSVTSTAIAGEYDGLWIAPSIPDEVYMIRHDNGLILVVSLLLDTGLWEAYYGQISGKSAVINTLVSKININANINFTSPTSGMLIINSCTPIDECLPPGSMLNINKFF